ncbi:MAG: phosphoadenosine phosphosulfate reductase family protein, partial [Patescibacteria group bacterium]
MKKVVAFSGGKDSTAVALLLHERGEDFDLLFTPTGNELPELIGHIDRVVAKVGKRLILPPNRSLADWIDHFEALPNNRQRWCTRLIKIAPCIAYLKANPGTVLCVGLRADEDTRQGLYGEHATYRYPLREAGMDLKAVLALC